MPTLIRQLRQRKNCKVPAKNSPLDVELEAKRKELKALNAAITERTQYHNDQEKLITEMVEAGNTQLMGLIHDTVVAKQELRDLKTDIRTAAQDKVLLNEDLEGLRRDIAKETTLMPAIPAFA